jgi:hypothetical protein
MGVSAPASRSSARSSGRRSAPRSTSRPGSGRCWRARTWSTSLAKEGSKQLIKGVRGGIPLLMGLADGVGAYYAGSVASYDIIGTQVIAVTGAKAGIGAAVAAGLCGWAIGVVGIAVVTALCTSKALGRVERQSQQTLVFNRRMTALEQRLEELKEKPEASQPRAA